MISKKIKIFLNLLLIFVFLLYFIFIISRVFSNKPQISIFVFTLTASIFLIILFLLKFFFSTKETKLKTIIFNIWLYIENNFFLDFLDKQKFWNKIFYRILLLISSIVKFLPIKKIIFIFLYFPWMIFLIFFFIELLTKDYVFYSLYLLSFLFLFKRLFLVFLYIAQVKLYQLEKTAFQRFFSCFSENCCEFFMKNMLFRLDLLFFQDSLDSKIKVFVWNGINEIDYFFLTRMKIFYIKSLIFPFVDNFINKINLIIFSSIFLNILLKQTFLSNIFYILIYIFIIYVLIYLLINEFRTKKYPKQEIFEDFSKISVRSEEYKQALMVKNKISMEEFKYFELSSDFNLLSNRDLIYKKINNLCFREIVESKSYAEEIEILCSSLDEKIDLSSLQQSQLNLVLNNFASWFEKNWKEGKINPYTFEFKE